MKIRNLLCSVEGETKRYFKYMVILVILQRTFSLIWSQIEDIRCSKCPKQELNIVGEYQTLQRKEQLIMYIIYTHITL